MADIIVQGDFLGVFTNGWFEVQDQTPVPTATSGYYRTYDSMPNNYITKCTGPKYNNERELYDLLITEAYNKHGVCMTYYITTYDINYDRIFGEDNDRRFVRKFNFMAFFTLPREEKLWNKFGIAGMDQFSIFVSKRHFKIASRYNFDQTSANAYDSYIPQVGDIIMSDYAKYVYEIVEVKEEVGMYLLSKQHVWEFIVKPFRDERIVIPPDVSATMPEMTKYANRSTDIFDNRTIIDSKKDSIKYIPKPCEKDPQNPFGNW